MHRRPKPHTPPRRTLNNYTALEHILRVAWSLTAFALFRPSPRPFWFWRNLLLKGFGAEVGDRVRVAPSAKIFAPWNLSLGHGTSIGESAFIYNLGMISLGNDVTVSQRVHLCAGTHDYTQPEMPLLKPPINLGSDVWVAAEAFVGPNVSIGDRAVVAARAVVVRDVPAGTIVAGNPARAVGTRASP